MKIIKITNIDTPESFKNFNKELEELCTKYNYKLINDNLQNLLLVTIEWKPQRNFDGIKEQFLVDKNLWRNELYECLVDKEVYFGEISGKHSEIYGNLDEEDFFENDSEEDINDFYNKHFFHFTNPHSFLRKLHDNLLDNEGECETSLKIKKLLQSFK